MVSIRLRRGGSKKRPFYHIVVADSRSKRDGRHVERLGYFNRLATAKEVGFRIDKQRFDYWIANGAKASARVANLVKGRAAPG